VSDSKNDRDPNDPSYYRPPRFRENTGTTSPEPDRQALSVPRPLDDSTLPRRTFTGNEGRGDKSSDAFAEALARLMQEQRDGERKEVPAVLHRHPSPLIGQLTVAIASTAVVGMVAAVVAMVYVTLSLSQEADRSALRVWQTMKATLLTPPPSRRASALVVRNVSGFVNEPLQLGVSVVSPDPGATVTVKGMPANARLTAGVPTGLTEWQVSADEISSVKIIPPSDFVGETNVSAELHSADGAALVISFMQVTWKPVPANNPPTVTTSIAPAQQSIQPASPPPAAVEAKPPQSPPPAPAETAHQLTANESAALVRRAQEILAFGDVREARLLLIRAAEAHDARAALMLAKTFDPTIAKQLTASQPAPNLAQARGWYQKAREWGSPDAQRQLDALASYR
jgi:hypothetical protein